MTKICFKDKNYTVNDSETILECLLRHDICFPHSCKSGTCQSCLSLTTDEISRDWQNGLKSTLTEQGYFLPCIARPKKDLSLSLPIRNDTSNEAHILELFTFNHDVLCIRLIVDDLTTWTAGRYINLINPNQDIRSYSIANCPNLDGYIELHIKIIQDGLMSSWINTQAKPGMSVNIRGPIGDCYYSNPTAQSFPMVLAGTGTGVAPLFAIARDALYHKHRGEITLIHGGVTDSDLYLNDKLMNMSESYDAFHYEKCTLTESKIATHSAIDKLMLNVLDKVQDPRLYLCGPEETIKNLKMKAFLSGVASSAIHSDAFIASK